MRTNSARNIVSKTILAVTTMGNFEVMSDECNGIEIVQFETKTFVFCFCVCDTV